MKGRIGLIANPASGKDIRRMVAYGTTMDNMAKVNIVRRIIMGACAMGVTEIHYMPDLYCIAENAVNGIYQDDRPMISNMTMHEVNINVVGREIDSTHAAGMMADLGVEAVIVLGGDGTARAVAKEIGDVPMIAISTGTNNVFPLPIEGTIAGMAAGAYACMDNLGDNLIRRSKRIEILRNGELADIALIDAVCLESGVVGSRAIWTTDNMREIYLTRCQSDTIGISSIGGRITDVGEHDPRGLFIRTDDSAEKVIAPIAPGLMKEVGIVESKYMEPDQIFEVGIESGVIAVDGERNYDVYKKDHTQIRLTMNGPYLLNVPEILRKARKGSIHVG